MTSGRRRGAAGGRGGGSGRHLAAWPRRAGEAVLRGLRVCVLAVREAAHHTALLVRYNNIHLGWWECARKHIFGLCKLFGPLAVGPGSCSDGTVRACLVQDSIGLIWTTTCGGTLPCRVAFDSAQGLGPDGQQGCQQGQEQAAARGCWPFAAADPGATLGASGDGCRQASGGAGAASLQPAGPDTGSLDTAAQAAASGAARSKTSAAGSGAGARAAAEVARPQSAGGSRPRSPLPPPPAPGGKRLPPQVRMPEQKHHPRSPCPLDPN